MKAIDKVVRAWQNNTEKSVGNVSARADGIYSYAMRIACEHEGTVFVLNPGLRSPTTSRHCNAVAAEYPRCQRVDTLPS